MSTRDKKKSYFRILRNGIQIILKLIMQICKLHWQYTSNEFNIHTVINTKLDYLRTYIIWHLTFVAHLYVSDFPLFYF